MTDRYYSSNAQPVRRLLIPATTIVNSGTYADSAAATFTIPVFAGEAVTAIGVKLIEAFDDSGTGSALNVEVGDGSDANGYITSAPIHVDQTEISVISTDNATYSGAYFNDGTTDNTINGKLYTSDDTIDVIITPAATGNAYSLNELTAGELLVTVFLKSYN